MNLSEMFNRFHADLKSPDWNRYPIALVKSYLDEAERVVNKLSKTIRASSIVDSVSDQRLYALPTDILDWQIRDVYYSTTDSTERERLVPTSIAKLDEINKGWRDDEGEPRFWYLDKEQSKWGLYPYEETVDTGTNCIEILYRKKHTKMTTYYITGTVDVTNGSTAVAGNSTAFIGNVVSGDELGIGKLLDRTTDFPTTFFALSATPTDDAVLAIAEYTGATATAQSYIISSPSSIENDELNICSVLWAMGLAKGKDGDIGAKNALQGECMARVAKEVSGLKKDAVSQEAIVPAGYAPFSRSEINGWERLP